MSSHSTKKLLRDHGLAPSKRFGQNFLVNRTTAESIVSLADISSDETIIEVGTGLGALTNIIAGQAKAVIGIEVDHGIIAYHLQQNILEKNVTLVQGDILKTDFKDLAQRYGTGLKIIANLPYSISNPFIFKLIDNREYISTVVVMLQKEVGERLTAPPSTKQYGIPTVLLNRYATVKKMMTVGPGEFHPRPKIDSQVLRIEFGSHSKEAGDRGNHDLFQKIIRSSFAKRRKTLLNNLASATFSLRKSGEPLDRQAVSSAIGNAGISPSERAENLTVDDFIRLTSALEAVLGN